MVGLDWNAEPGESCDTQADVSNLNNKIDNNERITVLIKYLIKHDESEAYYQHSTTGQVFARRASGPDGNIIGVIEISDMYYLHDAIDLTWFQYTLDGGILRHWALENKTMDV